MDEWRSWAVPPSKHFSFYPLHSLFFLLLYFLVSHPVLSSRSFLRLFDLLLFFWRVSTHLLPGLSRCMSCYSGAGPGTPTDPCHRHFPGSHGLDGGSKNVGQGATNTTLPGCLQGYFTLQSELLGGRLHDFTSSECGSSWSPQPGLPRRSRDIAGPSRLLRPSRRDVTPELFILIVLLSLAYLPSIASRTWAPSAGKNISPEPACFRQCGHNTMVAAVPPPYPCYQPTLWAWMGRNAAFSRLLIARISFVCPYKLTLIFEVLQPRRPPPFARSPFGVKCQIFFLVTQNGLSWQSYVYVFWETKRHLCFFAGWVDGKLKINILPVDLSNHYLKKNYIRHKGQTISSITHSVTKLYRTKINTLY